VSFVDASLTLHTIVRGRLGKLIVASKLRSGLQVYATGVLNLRTHALIGTTAIMIHGRSAAARPPATPPVNAG